jgi:exodeoxyribonuclease VII small subunit
MKKSEMTEIDSKANSTRAVNKNLSYEKAYAELEKIAQEIEDEEVSVDALAEKVKRASQLVTFCQNKLKATEDEVSKILSNMDL